MTMRWKLLLVLCIVLSSRAYAQDLPACPPGSPIAVDAALLCWINATQDVNGNPLPTAPADGSLTKTRVQRAFVADPAGACAWNATTNEAQNFDVTPDVTRMFFEGLKPGKWCFRLRHSALNVPDSDWSVVGSKVTKNPAPPAVKTRPPVTSIY